MKITTKVEKTSLFMIALNISDALRGFQALHRTKSNIWMDLEAESFYPGPGERKRLPTGASLQISERGRSHLETARWAVSVRTNFTTWSTSEAFGVQRLVACFRSHASQRF
jgi:hypothetical protein